MVANFVRKLKKIGHKTLMAIYTIPLLSGFDILNDATSIIQNNLVLEISLENTVKNLKSGKGVVWWRTRDSPSYM